MNLWNEIMQKERSSVYNAYECFPMFYCGDEEGTLLFLKSLTGILRKHFMMLENFSRQEKEDCLSDVVINLMEKKKMIKKLYDEISGRDIKMPDREKIMGKYLSILIHNYIVDSRFKKRKIDETLTIDCDSIKENAADNRDVMVDVVRQMIFKVYESNREKYSGEYYILCKTREWAESNGLDLQFFL